MHGAAHASPCAHVAKTGSRLCGLRVNFFRDQLAGSVWWLRLQGALKLQSCSLQQRTRTASLEHLSIDTLQKSWTRLGASEAFKASLQKAAALKSGELRHLPPSVFTMPHQNVVSTCRDFQKTSCRMQDARSAFVVSHGFYKRITRLTYILESRTGGSATVHT